MTACQRQRECFSFGISQFIHNKMTQFIQRPHLSFEAVTQTHFFQQRLDRLHGDKQLCDKLRGQSLRPSRQGWVAFPPQVIQLIKLQGLERKRNLHRWCLLCDGPAGCGGARPREGPPALSCHPRPSQRWGAWVWGWRSCWSCAPAYKLSQD